MLGTKLNSTRFVPVVAAVALFTTTGFGLRLIFAASTIIDDGEGTSFILK